MSAQLYYCVCRKPFQYKTTLVNHAKKSGCNPPPVPKKRKTITSPSENFLYSIPDLLKDVEPRWCRENGCFIDRLGFGIAGGHKTACKKHKDGLVCLGKLCDFLGCVKSGKIVIEGAGRKFCKSHLDELVARGLPTQDVKRQKNKVCAHAGCGLCPSYDGNTFCKTHSPTGLSDDKRVCAEEGCDKKRPTFGFDGESKTMCIKHMKPGMHSRKLCADESCTTSASFGFEGGTQTHCKKHMLEGQYLVNNPTCEEEACNKQPAFGDPVTAKASHCKAHAPEGFIDVRNKRCIEEGCDSLVKDATPFCVSHGGGKTCTLACCMFGGPYPQYGNPDDGSRICAFGARALMEDAMLNDDIDRSRLLMTHFGRKTMMVLNQQSAFRTEIEKKYWWLLDTCAKVYFDESVSDKPKTTEDLRPDIFYVWKINGTKMAIHIEYDEGAGHEDDDDRLRYISETSGTTGNVYVIRVDANVTGSSGALCTRTQKGSVVFYTVNDAGRQVALRVANAVIERIQWIKGGLGPDDTRPAKAYF
ncbi:unnamed protein product [Ectocarpus sp. 4 AP-2014]|uniref:EsV-1-115 n=1 Tax=Ectocarpus siliculosus virus 1 (isolate New Zealand/Kaikoura/1988) TaxID=654926 RepID=Q8QNG4_ESV1K|nr:EsV-1-115 [Ectocarpus siliculosus virus 1]AAK14533.1 EsV-1-115 [Ectocarpus siliculosus virus 1]